MAAASGPATTAGPDRRPDPALEFSLAYAALLLLVSSLTTAALIGLYRRGLYVPTRLVVLGLSMFTACAFAPFVLPTGWRRRLADAPYAYPLTSFAVLIAAFAAYGLGRLAPGLLYVYAALGLVGLGRALGVVRGMSWRHYAFLPAAALLAVYVFFYFTPWNYASVYAPEQALLGTVRKDTYYATIIAHMIQAHGTVSTGLDGLAPHRYHIASHAWFAALGRVAGTMPLLTYSFIHQLVLLPAQFLALAFSLICAAGRRRGVIGLLAAAAAMVFFTDAIGRPSHYVSESYAAGLMGLLFFWPLLLDLMSRPERVGRAAWARLALALAGVVILNSVKLSVGLLWTLALGWVVLRREGWRWRGLATIALAGLLAGAAFLIFNDPGQAAVVEPLKFLAHHPRLLFLTNWIIPGLYLAALALTEGITSRAGLGRAIRERRTVGAETLVLMAAVSALPALMLWLSIGWAWFFFNVPQWPAMSMLAGVWDARPLLTPARRRTTYAAAAALALAGVYLGATFIASAARPAGMERSRELARAGGKGPRGPTPARPYGAELDALLGASPAYQAYCRIMDAAAARPGDFAVYAPAANDAFWHAVANCTAQPMFVPAVTGKVMLYGLLPRDYDCDLEFYGYPDYGPDAYARDVDDAALCRHAREKGFASVFILNDVFQPERNRMLECPD
jgi:hypothetical protein